VTRNASGRVVLPTAAPTVDVFLGSSKIYSGLVMFPTDRLQVPGLFVLPIRLSLLDPGIYNCVVRWTSGSFHGVLLINFQIVDGGSSNGTCLAMAYFAPPAGQFLVRQTDAGIILQGKNPR
jgi:hypothetical protein